MKKSLLWLLPLLIAAVVFIGCPPPDDPPPANDYRITFEDLADELSKPGAAVISENPETAGRGRVIFGTVGGIDTGLSDFNYYEGEHFTMVANPGSIAGNIVTANPKKQGNTSDKVLANFWVLEAAARHRRIDFTTPGTELVFDNYAGPNYPGYAHIPFRKDEPINYANRGGIPADDSPDPGVAWGAVTLAERIPLVIAAAPLLWKHPLSDFTTEPEKSTINCRWNIMFALRDSLSGLNYIMFYIASDGKMYYSLDPQSTSNAFAGLKYDITTALFNARTEGTDEPLNSGIPAVGNWLSYKFTINQTAKTFTVVITHMQSKTKYWELKDQPFAATLADGATAINYSGFVDQINFIGGDRMKSINASTDAGSQNITFTNYLDNILLSGTLYEEPAAE